STSRPTPSCIRLPITTYGESPHSHLPMKVMTVSSTSDTISRNATPSTSPNEIRRTRTSAITLDERGPVYGHTILSALLSDEKVAEAPIPSVASEMIAAPPPALPL